MYDGEESERLQALYTRFPELAQLPAAAQPALAPWLGRHTYKGPQLDQLDARHGARRAQEDAARNFASQAAWVSPPIALTLAMERLAGVGPEAASAYRSHIIDALRERIRWVLVQAWTLQPLDQHHFDALVASQPEPFRWQPRGILGPCAALAVWLILAWLSAATRLAGKERHSRTR